MMELPVTNPFTLSLTVGQADIDEQGHVSNVNIVRWMSRVAYAHSAALGYDTERYREVGGWFVVRRHEIDYFESAMLGDELLLVTWPSGIGKVKAERQHRIYRKKDEALVASGMNIWAYVGIESRRPQRIPQEILSTFDPERFR